MSKYLLTKQRCQCSSCVIKRWHSRNATRAIYGKEPEPRPEVEDRRRGERKGVCPCDWCASRRKRSHMVATDSDLDERALAMLQREAYR